MKNSSKIVVALFLFLMRFCLPGLMMAQPESEQEDVVYLKDGRLRGQIIEEIGNEAIRLKMLGRNIWVDKEEVEQIKREEVPGVNHYKSSGYINHTGMDMLPGVKSTTVRFQMVNGFQILPKLSIGVGIGFVPYSDPLGLIPVFLESRYKFQESNATPFLFLRTGYNFTVLTNEDWELKSHSGGFNLNPGIGLEFHNAEFGWYLTAGLNVDKARYEESWNNRTIITDLSFRRLQVGIGLIF